MPWHELWARWEFLRTHQVTGHSEDKWEQAKQRTRAESRRVRGAH